jgi:hypothetical protein
MKQIKKKEEIIILIKKKSCRFKINEISEFYTLYILQYTYMYILLFFVFV